MKTNSVSRRAFCGSAAVAGVSLASAAFAQSDGSPTALKSEFLLSFSAELETPLAIGATPHGERTIYPVKGGTFEGPKLKGTVLPNGGDWALRRPDGALELDVRASLKTDDDQLIYVYYRGIIDSPTDGSGLYFRTTPVFETASEKYGWLNRIISVGVGRTIPGGVAYDVHRIL